MTEETTQALEKAFTPRPAKIRTSITIRPEFLEQAKQRGPSVSAVIDAALATHFSSGEDTPTDA